MSQAHIANPPRTSSGESYSHMRYAEGYLEHHGFSGWAGSSAKIDFPEPRGFPDIALETMPAAAGPSYRRRSKVSQMVKKQKQKKRMNTQDEIDAQFSRLRALREEQLRLSASLPQLVQNRVFTARLQLEKAQQNFEFAVEQQNEIEGWIYQQSLNFSRPENPGPSNVNDICSQSILGQSSPLLYPHDLLQSPTSYQAPNARRSSECEFAELAGQQSHSSSSSVQPASGPSSQPLSRQPTTEDPSRQPTMADNGQSQTSMSPLTLLPPLEQAPPIEYPFAAPLNTSTAPHSPIARIPSLSSIPSIPSVHPSRSTSLAELAPVVPVTLAPEGPSTSNTSLMAVPHSGSQMATPSTVIYPLPSVSTSFAPIVPAAVLPSSDSSESWQSFYTAYTDQQTPGNDSIQIESEYKDEEKDVKERAVGEINSTPADRQAKEEGPSNELPKEEGNRRRNVAEEYQGERNHRSPNRNRDISIASNNSYDNYHRFDDYKIDELHIDDQVNSTKSDDESDEEGPSHFDTPRKALRNMRKRMEKRRADLSMHQHELEELAGELMDIGGDYPYDVGGAAFPEMERMFDEPEQYP